MAVAIHLGFNQMTELSDNPQATEAAPPENRGLSAFHPIQLRKASDEVLAVLIDAIRGGLFRPGDLLPRERDLAARLEVSRDVVREAIDILRRDKIISSRRGRSGGTIVRSLDNLVRLQAELQGGMRANLRSLLEFRRIIEPAAALLCARHASDEDFDGLQALADQLGAETGVSAAEMLEIDIRFHVLVGELSRNEALAASLRSTMDEIILLRSFLPFGHLERDYAVRIQRSYLDALRTRNPETVAATVSDHLAALEDVLLGMTLEPLTWPAPSTGGVPRA